MSPLFMGVLIATGCIIAVAVVISILYAVDATSKAASGAADSFLGTKVGDVVFTAAMASVLTSWIFAISGLLIWVGSGLSSIFGGIFVAAGILAGIVGVVTWVQFFRAS